ncbi:adenosylcobinamide-GDP ribazoletransferase [Marimonas lutisalis]|uniref:adenosylcobinamide-GDP ribazoletransferase n=1 Tax=Marimonas lutisalis TaxID=2545756 RepID=UPI0010F6DB0A|nr:adenosylcobinamide-GDP ribazoletransferase [Marimonas lutisalis]
MRENAPLAQPRDLAVALSLLTRLPLSLPDHAYARGAASAWAWPLVGLVVAGLAATVALIAQAVGIPYHLSALLALATLVLITGAMHEDGLADLADGFWGGFAPARRLEIMRDSRIGAYGVIALALSLGLRGTALATLETTMIAALFASAALSRASMAATMRALPNARTDGLSHSTGRPAARSVALAAGLALLSALLLCGWAGLWAALAALGVMAATQALARAKIGGQTGDVLGATQQLTEIAALLALTAAL